MSKEEEFLHNCWTERLYCNSILSQGILQWRVSAERRGLGDKGGRRDSLGLSDQCVGRLVVSLQIRVRAMLRKGLWSQRSWVLDTGFLIWQNPPREAFARGVRRPPVLRASATPGREPAWCPKRETRRAACRGSVLGFRVWGSRGAEACREEKVLPDWSPPCPERVRPA